MGRNDDFLWTVAKQEKYELAKKAWGTKVDENNIEYVPAMIKCVGHIRIYRGY